MAEPAPLFLIALTGLPASGKSTFARKAAVELDRRHGLRVMTISSDNVRAEIPVLSLRFLPELEKAVRELSLSRVRDGLEQGFPVIFDDMNYYRSMRREIYNLARDLALPYALVYLCTPEPRCLELNAARGRKVPDDVIVTDALRFDPPGEVPWDEPLLAVEAGAGLDAAVERLAAEVLQSLPRLVPPRDEPGSGTLARTRGEDLELLSRRVLSELYRATGLMPNAAALRRERLAAVVLAEQQGLCDADAEEFFRAALAPLFT